MCCSSRDLPLAEVTETTEDRTGCLLQVDLGCPVDRDGGGDGDSDGGSDDDDGGGGGGGDSGGHGEDCKRRNMVMVSRQ